MPLAEQPLTLCAGSMVRYSFSDIVPAAAESGFAAVTMTKRLRVLAQRREELSSADMLAMLRDHGLRISEIEGTADWLPGPGPAADGRALAFDESLELAAGFGARAVVAFHDDRPAAPLPVLVDAFAAACDRAAEFGLQLTIEFLPWTAIPDLSRALGIVEASGRPNGRVLFDTWHHGHSGLSSVTLTPAQAALVSCVQIDDAQPPLSADLVHETTFRRCLPGTGTLPLTRMLAELDSAGVDCPVAPEVFDERVLDLTARDWAGRLAESTRQALDAAAGRAERRQ